MELETPASVRDVLHALRDDDAFREAWSDALAGVGFKAFRWETPRLVAASLDDPFEAVVVDDPGLERPQDADAFAEHFEADPAAQVLVIPNLSGDATLIVPAPAVERTCYCHLAAFVRHAPAGQRAALWQATAEATLARVGARAVWLSTAGGGVPWLHVRLDDRPKYYAHMPYRT